MSARGKTAATREASLRDRKIRRIGSSAQPDAREGQAERNEVAERLVVPSKPGNAGGGKEPQLEATQEVARTRRLGNLVTPIKVQKLQSALQATAKEAPDFRFYALYDKV